MITARSSLEDGAMDLGFKGHVSDVFSAVGQWWLKLCICGDRLYEAYPYLPLNFYGIQKKNAPNNIFFNWSISAVG